MSLVLTPNFQLPQISVAPDGHGPSPESVRATKEELRLLVVDSASLTTEERLRLWPRDSEIRDWHVAAADGGVSLVVLRTRDTIELYTTQQDRQLACSLPLLTIAQRGQSRAELARVRVTPRRGMDVARHLFKLAAGIGTTRGKARVMISRIEAAASLAAKAGCLSPTVDSLFRTATKVGQRVDEESLLGHPNPSEALREVADIGAARILEEELWAWKTEQSKLYRSLSMSENLVRSRMGAASPMDDPAYIGDDEAPSGVRIRVAPDLDLRETFGAKRARAINGTPR